MKREARVLLDKAADSLFLSIDHFNRPYDRGRHEAVLIFLDRAFELLLKAVIIHCGGEIREQGASQTIGFDKCVRKCVSDAKIRCLTEENALTIQNINTLRDAAQHYWIDLSEQHLYVHAQAGLTLFVRVLADVFGQALTAHFPDRVLPISVSPPQQLAAVLDAEFEDIRRLCKPKSRRQLQAMAKLRGLAILEKSLAGDSTQPGNAELRRNLRDVQRGKSWAELFPGISTLRLETTGTGFNISLQITKGEGEPVRLVGEDDPNAKIVGVRRVNELDFYNLGLTQLAEHMELTSPKCLAVVRQIGLQDDLDCFKAIRIGSQTYKRYSQKALVRIRAELPQLDLDQVWRTHGPRRGR